MSDLFAQVQADPGLFAYLRRQSGEGDHYGYASAPNMKMPNPRGSAIAADAATSFSLGATGLAALAKTGGLGALVAVPAFARSYMSGHDARQGYLARSGRDDYSRQVEENLAMMRGQR